MCLAQSASTFTIGSIQQSTRSEIETTTEAAAGERSSRVTELHKEEEISTHEHKEGPNAMQSICREARYVSRTLYNLFPASRRTFPYRAASSGLLAYSWDQY